MGFPLSPGSRRRTGRLGLTPFSPGEPCGRGVCAIRRVNPGGAWSARGGQVSPWRPPRLPHSGLFPVRSSWDDAQGSFTLGGKAPLRLGDGSGKRGECRPRPAPGQRGVALAEPSRVVVNLPPLRENRDIRLPATARHRSGSTPRSGMARRLPANGHHAAQLHPVRRGRRGRSGSLLTAPGRKRLVIAG